MSHDTSPTRKIVGRGTDSQPANRFERVHREDDFEQLDAGDAPPQPLRIATEFLADTSRSIIVENDSPDIPFRFSINPYRGCEHGCSYCYARPYHEYLGMNAGLDFETKVLVKHDAAALLREELARPTWEAEPLMISGVTDCYQPAERRFRITRSILEVLLEARQPAGLITKNALVLRDLDLLSEMAARRLVHVAISITTLDAGLARAMEPRTATPEARLRAIRELSAAGAPVRVMAAPMIPGLNDHELPAILTAAKEAGAGAASYTFLRLPLAVGPIFSQWLKTHRPELQERVLSRLRGARNGKLNTSDFSRRMRGDGPYAAGVKAAFAAFSKKLGLEGGLPELDRSQFTPPRASSGQMRLF